MGSDDRAFWAIITFWVIAFLVKLGFIGLVLYVAHHFITKYW